MRGFRRGPAWIGRFFFFSGTVLVLCVVPALFAASGEPIIVVCDDNYPPYSFRNDDGILQGIIPDQWRAFSVATGRSVDFRAMDWADAQQEIAAGRADVLDSAFRTPGRELFLDFLPPYATLSVSVFHHSGISGISEPRDLRGFRVGVKSGDAAVLSLRNEGIRDLVLFSNYEAIIRAAAAGDLRIFAMDDPPAHYYLYKYRLDDEYSSAFTLSTGQFHRAVRKNRRPLADGSDLFRTLQDGFLAVDADTYQEIDQRWLGTKLAPRINWQILGLIGGAGLFFILFLLTFTLVLRREVARKTRDLEASERKNRAFIAALPDVFFITDDAGVYVEFISSNQGLLVRPSGEQVGRGMAEVGLDPEVLAAQIGAIEAIKRGSDLVVLEYDLLVPLGLRHFECRALRLERNRILFIVRDMTDAFQSARQLAASLAEKETLIKEVHHRVKNNMQVISSLVQLQSDLLPSSHERRMLEETQHRIRSMAQVHELLYRSESLSSIDGGEYIRLLTEELLSSYSQAAAGLETELRLQNLELSLDTAVPLGLIVNELVSNALKYAYTQRQSGRLHLVLEQAPGGRRVLTVADDGPGLPPDWEARSAASLGLTLVRSLTQQLRGALTVDLAGGTRISVEF